MEKVHNGTANQAAIIFQITFGALIAAMLFWMLESYMAVYFFQNAGFVHDWLIPHNRQLLFHRVLVVILFLAFGVVTGIAVSRGKRLERQLKELTELDPLTRIYNRRMFIAFLEKEIYRSKRYKEVKRRCDPALIMFDIDYFKKINDEYGNKSGDSVLVAIAGLVKKNIRSADILSRFGGEEFMIIAPETDVEGASVLAEKIRYLIAQHDFEVVGRVTITLGISVYKADDTLDSLVKRADKALYAAKKNGRNRVETA